MNRKLKPTKSAQQIKDEHVALMLSEIEKNIDSFKIALGNKKKFSWFKNTAKSSKNRISKNRARKQLSKRIYTNKWKKEEYKQITQIKKTKKIFKNGMKQKATVK